MGQHQQRTLGIAGSWILNTTLTKAYWHSHGLQGFLDPYRRFRDATRTAGCDPHVRFTSLVLV